MQNITPWFIKYKRQFSTVFIQCHRRCHELKKALEYGDQIRQIRVKLSNESDVEAQAVTYLYSLMNNNTYVPLYHLFDHLRFLNQRTNMLVRFLNQRTNKRVYLRLFHK